MHVREGGDHHHDRHSGEQGYRSLLMLRQASFHCAKMQSLVALSATSLKLLKETRAIASYMVSASHPTSFSTSLGSCHDLVTLDSEAVRISSITYVWSQVRGLQIWKGLLRLAGPTCSF